MCCVAIVHEQPWFVSAGPGVIYSIHVYLSVCGSRYHVHSYSTLAYHTLIIILITLHYSIVNFIALRMPYRPCVITVTIKGTIV